jgi:hypothetical protein
MVQLKLGLLSATVLFSELGELFFKLEELFYPACEMDRRII